MADKILTELVINRGTKQKFDDLPTKSPDELYFITDTETFQRKLTAGTNITIDESTNTISATGGGSDGETIKNQNTSSSIKKTYDWTGTLQEAKDQNVRELHPDWKIFITDDTSGGDSVYTKTEVDEKFVNKSDTEYIAQQPMPSNRYIGLTLGASGASYTAPADGYVAFCKQSSGANQNVNIQANAMMEISWASASIFNLSVNMPVKKGDTFIVSYTTGNATQWFRFIYAEGSK